MAIEIRDAVAEDAEAACAVMRRSIAELCLADHRNDPGILQRWLGNKNPGSFKTWLGQAGNSLLVAVEDGRIVGVGAVTDTGTITLNYVLPDRRFCGVSRRMLGALEARAAARGSTRCVVTSTETALRFYRANGYREDGPPVGAFEAAGTTLSKLLAAVDATNTEAQ